MTLSRRSFLTRSAGSAALALAAASVTLPLTGCSSDDYTNAIKYANTASTAVATVLSIVQIASGQGLLAAATFTDIKLILNETTLGITTVVAAIQAYQAAPGASVATKIQTAVSKVQANLSAALAAANITDPATLATYTGEINLVLQAINMIAGLFPSTASATFRAVIGTKASPFKDDHARQEFVAKFNAILAQHGHKQRLVA
jgi:hypothetical protein